MNTDLLARATFVLDRETAQQLGYVSRRLGQSRSDLVRGVLREPVAMMAAWLSRIPEDRPIDSEAAAALNADMQMDLVDFIDRHVGALGGDA